MNRPENATPAALALIPDANLFLQCKAIRSLDWRGLVVEADEIVIYIGRTLQREIDSLKSDGNQRRARRAREANSFFKDLLRAPGRTAVLSETGPRVSVTFMPRLDPDRPKSALLDLSKPDDCNIEEALAFRAAYPSFKTAILTHDTGPILTADEVELDHVGIPDGWLLEPEKDDRQKQIEDLRRQIKTLERQFPQLSVSAEDGQRLAVDKLALNIVEYGPPSPELVQSIVADLRDRYPLQEEFGAPSMRTGAFGAFDVQAAFQKYQPPDQSEIDRYRRDYEAWQRECEEFLDNLPLQLSGRSIQSVVAFRLDNTGTEPAKSLLITFSATPGIRLRPPPPEDEDDEIRDAEPGLPKAPEPPRGRYVNSISGSLADQLGLYSSPIASTIPLPASLFTGQVAHDPEAFYFSGGRPHEFVEEITLTCTRFRHRLDPEYFEFAVQWDTELRRTGSAIHCRISAENLPEPMEYVLPITVSHERGDISAEVEKFRPRPSPFGKLWRRAGGGMPSE